MVNIRTERQSGRPLVASFTCLATLVVTLSISTITAASTTEPCLDVRIDADPSWTNPAAEFRAIAATEDETGRHVVWRRVGDGDVLRTAHIGANGQVTLGSITLSPAPSDGLVHTLVARDSLLAVGLTGRVDLYRLVSGTWAFETSLVSPVESFRGRRLAIGVHDGTERVVASRYDGQEGGLSPIPSGPAPGPITVFRRDGSWMVETLLPVPPEAVRFGADVAIDGATIVVGAPGNQNSFDGGGRAVHVYDLVDGEWTHVQAANGFVWSFAPTGYRLALVGNTLIARNANNLSAVSHLQVFRRIDGLFQPTQLLFGSTAKPLGWELDAIAQDGGVRVAVALYRSGSTALIDSLVAYEIADGQPTRERILPAPAEAPGFAGFVSRIFDIAAVGGATPWIAATAPNDHAGPSVSIILLDGGCDEPGIASTPGDLNGDGIVDGLDLGILLGQWGPCPAGGAACSGDLNGDGVVDGADLGILLDNWTVSP